MWQSSCFHFFIEVFGSLRSYSKSTTNVIAAKVTLFDEATLRAWTFKLDESDLKARTFKLDESTLKARTFQLDETTNLEVGAFKLD